MKIHKSLVGERFGKLVAVKEEAELYDSFDHRRFYRCVCDCGNEVIVRYDRLKDGSKTSCGCVGGKSSPTRYIYYKGVSKNMREWSIYLGIPYMCLKNRLDRGWSIERALNTPIQVHKKSDEK